MIQAINFDLVVGNIGWKDTSLRHMGCNANLAQSLQLNSPDDIVGLKDNDLPIFTKQDRTFHYENDQLVLQGHVINKLHTHQNNVYLMTKKPLWDDSKKIIGLIYHCQLLDQNVLLNHSMQRSKPNPFLLSKRELECLHYLLQGDTARLIAKKLGLSKRTIDFYIENMKGKMRCANKATLITCALKAGYR